MKENKKPFSPLLFLASLGSGGIAIIPFAFFQYTHHTGKGLIKLSDIAHGSLPAWQQGLFYTLEGIALLFVTIHFVLSFIFLKGLIRWMREGGHKKAMANPLSSAGVLAPFVSAFMTMNVFIGPVRFFVPQMAANLQAMMLPALLVWIGLWAFLMLTEVRLLKTSFQKSFDVNKINFGWLLHPFALGMGSVTGAGIAAMAKNPDIAHTAAFLTLVSASMGVFLLVMNLIFVFKSHFAAEGLPSKQLLPSFLIVLPNITLYAITAFRLGHYAEHQFGAELGVYFPAVIVISFAFQTWYLLFGLALLRDYFKSHFFRSEFYVSQWGLVCPFVAYAVLGAFVYKLFVPSVIFYALILASTATAIGLFGLLIRRQSSCAGITKKEITCIT